MKKTKKIKIDFEKFENIIEILPSFYWHKQSYKDWCGKGAFVMGWLKWGIIIYIKYESKSTSNR